MSFSNQFFTCTRTDNSTRKYKNPPIITAEMISIERRRDRMAHCSNTKMHRQNYYTSIMLLNHTQCCLQYEQ